MSAGGAPTGREVDEMRARVEETEAFVSLVGHELRAPLASVSGYVEVLLDGDLGPLTPEQVHVLEVIGRNAERMRGLVDGLAPGARQQAGEAAAGAPPVPRDVDLTGIVRSAVDVVRPEARSREVTLHVDVEEALVRGDADALERAVVNVVGNAVKFTPPGGSVAVRCRSEDSGAAVHVTDTGIGIPAADLERVTDLGVRAANALEAGVPGTGLGLAFVRDVVERHAGDLVVSSIEGEGTRVRLWFPGPRAPRAGGGPGNATRAAAV